jgi:hypothetical protein
MTYFLAIQILIFFGKLTVRMERNMADSLDPKFQLIPTYHGKDHNPF